jgi:hypothetical protein
VRLQKLTIRVYDDVAGTPYVELTDERYGADGHLVPGTGSVSIRLFADELEVEDLRRPGRQ